MSMRLTEIVPTVLLGPRGRQRQRAALALFALVIYLLFAALQHAEVLLGFIDRAASWQLTSTYVGGALVFYGAIRTGLNERFAAEPSLAMPQTLFALSALIWSYAITGPARGAVMTLFVLILVFTMFSLRPAQSRGLALFAFAALVVVMGWKSQTDPSRYPPALEAVHLVFGAIVAGGVAVLAGRMGAMRDRLKSQKAELQRALERIGELALRDELTGLYNRRHMTTLLAAERSRQRRDGSPLAIALLDIDHFKRINDTHGHLAGDQVLRAFAEISRTTLRTTDVLARWGGEEFLLMLPGATLAQAEHSIERLREALRTRAFDAVAPGLRVTFSAGLSVPAVGDSGEACVDRADQAMYRAKMLGRDCSVVA